MRVSAGRVARTYENWLRVDSSLMRGSEKASVAGIEPLLSVREVAAVLGLSRATVYRLIDERELVCVRLDGRRLVEPEALRAFIAGRRQPGREPMQAAS